MNLEEYETGAKRGSKDGLGRYDLILAGFPHALSRFAVHMEKNAHTHGDHNWRKGLPVSNLVSSGIRHLIKYITGDRSEDHLAALCFFALALLETDYMLEHNMIPKSFGINVPNQTPVYTETPHGL